MHLAVPALRSLLHLDRSTIRHWSWSKEFRVRAEDNGKPLYLHWRDCKYRKEIAPDGVEQTTCSAGELIDRFAGQTPRVKAVVCDECA